ncbi:phosphopantetheine-binding protein [Nonomuraea sp. NPDC050404]|uniref:acyl carrier protein n=1 Tax=Nonomuraea sp. NPDC050404 TaxID=3155783 RepID=UPI0033F7182B
MGDERIMVREFITGYLPGHEIRDEEDIFAAGYANSLFLLQLVAMVERDFAVQVTDADLDIANFRTIDALCAFVSHKQRALSR